MRTFLISLCLAGLFAGCTAPSEDAQEPAASGAAESEPAASPGAASPAAAAVPAESPEEIAKQFFEAGNAGDEEAVLALLTTPAREAIASDDSMTMSEQQFESFDIGEATITGDEAVVPVDAVESGMEQKVNMKMRNEDNAWRVYGVGVELAEGMAFDINFENMAEMLEGIATEMGEALADGLGDAFGGMSDEEELLVKKAVFDSLEGVTSDELDAMWQNSEDFIGTPRLEAVTALAAGVQLTVDAGEHADALSGAVEMDLSGLSRVEAIEKLANAAGLYAVFPEPEDNWGVLGAMVESMAEGLAGALGDALPEGALDAGEEEAEEPAPTVVSFESGARPYPVQFNGPFLFTIDDLTTNAPNPTGDITFSVRSYGLSPGVLSLLKENSEATIVDQVEGPNGESLIEEGIGYYSGGEAIGSIYRDTFSMELFGLLKAVTHIAHFSGEQELYYPETVASLDLSGIEEEQTLTSGEFSIAVESVDDTSAQLRITGPEEAIDRLQTSYWATDGEGNDVDIAYASTDSWESGVATANVQTYDSYASLQMKLITVSESTYYPIAIENIALPDHEQMPESIEELSFEGDAGPLTAEFDKFLNDDETFREVAIRLTNHSNKDVETAYTNFVYLDANGEELDDFPSTLSGDFGMDGLAPLALAGSSSQTETSAFGAPEGTVSIRVEVMDVEFTDGTSWEAER